MESKFFLLSKTIIGLVLGVMVTVLPEFNVGFSADDAAVFTQEFDKILQGIAATLVIWGRITAGAALRIMP